MHNVTQESLLLFHYAACLQLILASRRNIEVLIKHVEEEQCMLQFLSALGKITNPIFQ